MRNLLLLLAFPCLVFASERSPSGALQVTSHLAKMQVEIIQHADGIQSSSDRLGKFKIDGIEIEVTPEEQIKASNWGLNTQDWAKYKYALEYTPRGLWTPNLDPPVVLGNMAKSEVERRRYAKLAMDLEIDRRQRENKFQESGNAYLKTLDPKLGEPKPLNGLEFYLGQGKTTLRTLFIDADNCDEICGQFVDEVYASTALSAQLNVYVTSKRAINVKRWLSTEHISFNELERKGVQVYLDNEARYKQYSGGGDLPFYVHQNDRNVKVIYAHRD
ncbi:hypothetical protein ACP3V3_02980 [Vibrio sp. PNB22_3_1]